MSHTTEVKSVVITDVKALKDTVKELQKAGIKCDLVENSKPRMYYANQVDKYGNFRYVLKLHNSPYDIGLHEYQHDNGNGKTTTAYKMVFDEYQNKIKSQVGAVCDIKADKSALAVGMFTQLYSKNALQNVAKKAGWPPRSKVKVGDNGEMQLVFERRK